MKKLWCAGLALALLLSGCGQKEEPPICGGETDNTNVNAPKTIESTELTELHTCFFRYDDDDGGDGYYYDFTLERADPETVKLAETGHYQIEVTAEYEILDEVQEIIERHQLVKNNGVDRYTNGLPPEYQPSMLEAVYASGEKLYFYIDGDPLAEWTGDLLTCFRKAFSENGYPEVRPAPSREDLTALAEASQMAYDALLAGEELMWFERYTPELLDYLSWETIVPFEQTRPYSLEEFLACMAELHINADGTSDVDFDKTCIDCGMDGVPELVIRIIGDAGESTNEFIIKYFDGKLQVCYMTESVYRSYESLSSIYGGITSYGSVSAAEHIASRAYLDAECNHHYAWREDEIYNFHLMDYPTDPFFELANSRSEELPDHLVARAVTLNPVNEDGTFNPPTFYVVDGYDPETYETKGSVNRYDESDPLVQMAAEAGVQLLYEVEADEFIGEWEMENGLWDIFESAPYPEYEPLWG